MRADVPIVLALLGLCAPVSQARADTLRVPVDFPTIQVAIDAAVDGDTVVVAPGTYHENVVFRGRDIVVRARSGAAVTIIDGGGVGPVVTFESGETGDCELVGFTLRNGAGAPADGRDSVGGGLLIVDSWPLVLGCTISDSTAGMGGGVYIGGTSEGATRLFSCVIEDNTAGSGGGLAQVGAWIDVRDALVRRNSAGSQGGGFYGRPVSGLTTILRFSVFEQNVSGGGGGGGTLDVDGDGEFVLDENLFRENVAAGPGGGLNIVSHATGGGAAEHGDVEDCDFLANRASRGGGLAVTATSDGTQGRHLFQRNLFARNVADGHDLGGAYWISQVGTRVRIMANTIVDNVAPAGGAALFAQGPDDVASRLWGSLVWGNGETPYAGELAVEWDYEQCNLEGGAPAGATSTENVEWLPRFYDPEVFDYSVSTDDPSKIYGSENGNDDPWSVIRSALPGREGYPIIEGGGTMIPGNSVWLQTDDLPEGSPGLAVIGFDTQWRPTLGGTLVPTDDLVIPFVVTTFGSGLGLLGTLPEGTPAGFEFWAQMWAVDALATKGWVATDTIKFRAR